MSNIGCRIFTKINRPDPALVAEFSKIPVANIADEMNRFFCMHANIKPFNKAKLFGVAFTVKSRPGDNLMLHKALDMAQPGDVIVVEAQGDMSNAITGEIMMTQAAVNGLAGVVIDGAIRDAEAIAELDMPVYAIGVQPKGPYKDGPGEINVPISCGGVTVNPGDIIIGDADGIVVIEPKIAEELLKKAQAKMHNEHKIMDDIRNKVVRSKPWMDKALEKLNCEVIEDCYK
mgnify:CR=1 FL=1